ncbi:hypothetical protein GWK47_022956 [Chionoecetes opilio]|uniref:Uncharacterized protein n=1 Tax=Chionoecetes opilio TaxID=41210 RepID=A0A8J4XQ34_CHIOP|nr:hypothetical protein GWK47_022956 [Chionoecetes opilio]
MGFLDLCRASLPLLLLMMMCAVPVHPSQQESVPEAAQQSEEAMAAITAEELKQSIREVLDEYSTISLPGLPTTTFQRGDSVSVSLSLADIYLKGLDDYEMDGPHPGISTISVSLKFHKLSLLVGTYSSSGHIITLPFNGEGPMYIHLHDLKLALSFKWRYKFPDIICAKKNSSTYKFDLRRMETHFENLNAVEGPDLGQVVDIVLPSFGQDIVKLLQVIISTKFDNTIIDLINTFTKCTTESRKDILKTDELMMVIDDVINDLLNGRKNKRFHH